jgi:hypothetical protein
VPLFVEELTKNVLESGLLIEDSGRYCLDGPLPPLAIPSALQDSLMARLDRLKAVKEIAQIGAAIGREFSYPLLHAIAGRDEATLRTALAQLVDSELASVPLGRAARRALHVQARARAGYRVRKPVEEPPANPVPKDRRVLARKFPDVVEAEPELLAHHFTQAGLTEPAIEYWGKAGDLALRRSAFKEAIAHLGKAIEMTEAVAGAGEKGTGTGHVKLQVSYGNALIVARAIARPRRRRRSSARWISRPASRTSPSASPPSTACGAAASSAANSAPCANCRLRCCATARGNRNSVRRASRIARIGSRVNSSRLATISNRLWRFSIRSGIAISRSASGKTTA